MSTTTAIRVPNLGTEADAGRILAWLHRVGDQVEAGDVVAELETDKAVVELEAPVAGRIIELMHSIGAEVPVGETLGLIEHD